MPRLRELLKVVVPKFSDDSWVKALAFFKCINDLSAHLLDLLDCCFVQAFAVNEIKVAPLIFLVEVHVDVTCPPS